MRNLLHRAGLIALGALGAVVVSLTTNGCSSYFECDHIVHAVDPGVFVLDRAGPRTEIGADENYRLEVSAGGKEVVETFTRAGRAHRNVYRASPAVSSPLRTNRGADAD